MGYTGSCTVKDNCIQYDETQSNPVKQCAISFPNASLVTVTTGDASYRDSLLIDGTVRRRRTDTMDAETLLVHQDIVYKENRRRRSWGYEYHRRREYYGRRRSGGQKQNWEVCLVDIGCGDGLRLLPRPSVTCPSPQELPRCQGSGGGELCIASKGECFVPKDLEDNCQDWYGTRFSVYQKETGTTRTSTTYTRTTYTRTSYTRTSTVFVVVANEPEAEVFQLEASTIGAMVVAALVLGGLALVVVVQHLRESQKATAPDGGAPAI